MRRILQWSLAVVAGFTLLGCGAKPEQKSTARTETNLEAIRQAEDRTQYNQENEKAVKELLDMGVFGKIECKDSDATVWVTARFLLKEFEEQEAAAKAALAHCFPKPTANNRLKINESEHGTQVGTYAFEQGLKMD